MSGLGGDEVGGGGGAEVVGAAVEVAGVDGLAFEVFDGGEALGAEFGGGLFGGEEELEGFAGSADTGGDGVGRELFGGAHG